MGKNEKRKERGGGGGMGKETKEKKAIKLANWPKSVNNK